jgi:putative transcriptional regulator
MKIGRKLPMSGGEGYLDGHLLVAMPNMADERFERSVIYLCAHSSEGAMGLIINKPADHIRFPELLVQLDIVSKQQAILLPPRAMGIEVLRGGPVETGRGFVLHSADFFVENSTLPIDDGVCLTATVEILRAIAKGDGPHQAVMALGYAGWQSGQLESEIQGNGWLHCAADRSILFDAAIEDRYALAMRRIGIDPSMLSSDVGHA